MSAKGRGGVTPDLDFCPTPPALAQACMDLLEIEDGARILFPSAGDGPFVRALAGRPDVSDCYVHAVELQDRLLEGLGAALAQFAPALPHHQRVVGPITQQRFQRFMARPPGGWDLVVDNPPFSEAEAFVRHGMFHLRPGGTLAYLLRLPFRGSIGRRKLFRRFPVWRYYMANERPIFYGDTSDATEYALFVWRKGEEPKRKRRHPREVWGVLRDFSWQTEAKDITAEMVEADRLRIRMSDWTDEGLKRLSLRLSSPVTARS